MKAPVPRLLIVLLVVSMALTLLIGAKAPVSAQGGGTYTLTYNFAAGSQLGWYERPDACPFSSWAGSYWASVSIACITPDPNDQVNAIRFDIASVIASTDTVTSVHVYAYRSAADLSATCGIEFPSGYGLDSCASTTGNFDFTIPTSQIYPAWLGVQVDASLSGSSPTETRIIKVVVTVDPTSVPGPSGTGIPSVVCLAPSPTDASFSSSNHWVLSGGATTSFSVLDLPPGAAASINVALTDAEYTYSMTYQQGLGGLSPGAINVDVGDQTNQVGTYDNAEHTYQSESIKYGAGTKTVTLARPATNDSHVNINFFCLSASPGTGNTAITAGGGSSDACELCDPPLGITDIVGILNWIICNLRRLFNCYLLPALGIIVGFIGTVIKYILSFATWVVKAAGDVVNWLWSIIGQIVAFIGGVISNIFKGIGNLFQTTGAADAANQTSAAARDLPTAINNGIAMLGDQLTHIFVGPVQNIFDLVIRLIGLAASFIMYFLGLIPLIIQSLIDGINSSGIPASATPACSNPSSLLFYPCLGFYILDNTIFAGPAKYLIPLLIAVIVLDNLTWLFNRVKEELSK